MKTDLFRSCGHCWVFQICWHIECTAFTTSSFRIWNSSTGIPSPPLALFVVMLSKAHLTSHSRMSGSRWVITPSWSSGSWRSFLYSSSVYSYHLFLISSASLSRRSDRSDRVPDELWMEVRDTVQETGIKNIPKKKKCKKFQRISRRDKKAFLSDQCKEIEGKNRMGKTRDFPLEN